MKKVGIYNRCSTEEEAQINALAIQAAESRERALAKGWEIVDQYIESESGTTIHKRSEYQRLLDDMETDKFDIVMIKSIDRLMRSAKDWYIFLDKLTQNQKQLHIYIEDKFYTPQDSLITGIKAILAEDFSRELSKKIKNAHRRRQEKKTGLNITGPMFGWDKVGKDVFEINKGEADAYRLAFELAKEGKGFYSIANIMYARGVRSKRGTRISESQWRKMIYASRAHGTVILHTYEYDFETKKKVPVPQDEWVYVENALPPIISKEYHMEILEILSARTIANKFVNYTRDMSNVGMYELSNKLYCATCNAVYYRVSYGSGSNKTVEWKCSNALRMGRKTVHNPEGCNNLNLAEESVMELLNNTYKPHYEVLFGREEVLVDDILTVIRKIISQTGREDNLTGLQKTLERLQKRKKVLFDKLLNEVIDDVDFKDANLELSEKILKLQDEINSIKSYGNEYNDLEQRLSQIKESLQEGILDKAKCKALIRNIDKVIVCPDGMLKISFDKLFDVDVKYISESKATKKREKINRQIISFFRENPHALLKDIPDALFVSSSYVNASIKMLKEQGLIRYERYGNHTGKWIVIEADK